MKMRTLVCACAVLIGPCTGAAAETHSDFNKNFALASLKTFEFKEATEGTPDFFVAFYVGLKDRWRGYDKESINLGKPEKEFGKAVDDVLRKFYRDRGKSRS